MQSSSVGDWARIFERILLPQTLPRLPWSRPQVSGRWGGLLHARRLGPAYDGHVENSGDGPRLARCIEAGWLHKRYCSNLDHISCRRSVAAVCRLRQGLRLHEILQSLAHPGAGDTRSMVVSSPTDAPHRLPSKSRTGKGLTPSQSVWRGLHDFGIPEH